MVDRSGPAGSGSRELEVAVLAARTAGGIIRAADIRTVDVQAKGAADLITAVDREAEVAIREILVGAFPGSGFIAEESEPERRDARMRWIVDPLDGTLNFVAGQPVVAVSIALERDGRTELGVVYQPFTDELLVAERGAGAWCNGAPIHVSACIQLWEAVIHTGLPYDVREAPEASIGTFTALAGRARSIRIFGSAALDLCAVASGRADGYLEVGLQSWDVAAGTIIVTEAGGSVTHRPEMADRQQRWTIASNRLIQAELLDLVAGSIPGSGSTARPRPGRVGPSSRR